MNWWHYLLLANIYLTLFFGFYQLFLRKETFFNLNRIYLVGAAILSFMIPMIQSEWIKNLFITKQVQHTISQISPVVIYQFNIAATSNHITLGQVVACIYMSGMLILLVKFVHQLITLRQVIKDSETTASYSFFNNIKIEEHDAENQVITAHELAHARQLHSVDIILLEAVMIINWFNPVVYFYRSAIKHIHEFIADRDALRNGTSKAEYAMLLLSQTFNEPPHYLVNPFFSHSMLKERILMLQKTRSQRTALIKYGLSAPLFALMLVLSSATVTNSKALNIITQKAEAVLSKPANFEVAFYKNLDEVPDLHRTQPAPTANLSAFKRDITNAVFTDVEHPATFPGGNDAFLAYISKNVHYTDDARKGKAEGKVFVSFIVEQDGSLSDVKVDHGINPDLDKQALDAVKGSPLWTPGVQNGLIVRQQFTIPVDFKLVDASANAESAKNNEAERADVYTAVENSATFPGGLEKFYQYLSRSIHYPADARRRNLQGKVIVTFVVETDGALTDIKIARGLSSELNSEAVRVIRSSPHWIPGMQNGRVVRQQYTVPINFTLSDKGGIVRDTAKLYTRQGEQLKGAYTFNLGDANAKSGVDSNRRSGHSLFTGLGAVTAKNPMFVIDGITTQPVAVAKINNNNLQSVDVLKNNATKTYSDKAMHGIMKMLALKRHDSGDDEY